MALSHDEQARAFLDILRKRLKPVTPGGALYEAVLTWLGLPLSIHESLRKEIVVELQAATGLKLEQLHNEVATRQIRRLQEPEPEQQNGEAKHSHVNTIKLKMGEAQVKEDELDAILPKDGYFKRYRDFTLESEAPLSYHVFCAMAGLAATVNRRVFLDMGNHKLYPPFGVFILGNSGIKKTSAADIIVSLLRESALTPIYAEKLTPEALIDGMRGGNATGLVYAPEMTVLISKQKYMESIIPLLTRFMDSPDVWNSGTIMRGKVELRDVAITCIMCSTIDWFVKNTPEALFGGGFIARNILVMEEYSSRVKPLPPAENTSLRQRLLFDLAHMHELQGQVRLSEQVTRLHTEWYLYNKLAQVPSTELFETYFSRKPSHLLRLAMCLHIGTHYDLLVCQDCWDRARQLLEWIEDRFDLLSGKMFRSGYGEDQELVMRTIERMGGNVQWSLLARRLSYKLPSNMLRAIVSNLKEQGLVEDLHSAVDHRIKLLKKGD